MNPDRFVETYSTAGASAILRCDDTDVARRAMAAVLEAGFTVVEFTLTVPGAFDLIAELASQPGIVVGAGTVLDVESAERAVAAGARFLVSPVVDGEVIAAASLLGVAAMPGCHTPTEMLTAHRAGAQLLKLFPAPAGGPAYLRACRGPLPFLRVVPTNGVDEGNVADWFAAGAHAVGFTTALFDPAELRERRFDAVRARAERLLRAVGAARS